MKSAWLAALAVAVAVPAAQIPAAHAQVVIQAPPIPGVTVPLAPPPPPPGYRDDYWRRSRDGDWERRAEMREEEARREDWRNAHCVRDYRGEEYCRR